MSEMRRYSHVLFDFDGVLCDSLADAMAVFNEIREREFPQLPCVSCREDMTIVYGGSLRTALSKWLSAADGRRFFDLHSAAMAERSDNLSAFPGVNALLEGLPPRSCSIVTSAYSRAVEAILSRGCGGTPASIRTIAGRELRKPKSEKILTILTEMNVPPQRAIYVGDTESDILYCKDVPMDVIAVGYGYHPVDYLRDKGATHVVEGVDELRELVRAVLESPQANGNNVDD